MQHDSLQLRNLWPAAILILLLTTWTLLFFFFFCLHHFTSSLPLKRSAPDVNLSFHKSHDDTPTCFLSLLTQHQGRTWESEVQFWTRTECLCPPMHIYVCVCVCRPSEEVLHWGQTIAPVGLTPSGARMSAWFRGQGCNQTAGRLPRLLCGIGVDAGVCLCVCVCLCECVCVLYLESRLTAICCIYIFVCLSRCVGVCVCVSLIPPKSCRLFTPSPSHSVSSLASWTPSCLCLASITRRNCLDVEMIAIGFEQ